MDRVTKDRTEARRLLGVFIETRKKIKFNDLLVSASDLVDILKSDFDIEVDISEMEHNGWQMDFWINFDFEHGGVRFGGCIEGGGYYGTLVVMENE